MNRFRSYIFAILFAALIAMSVNAQIGGGGSSIATRVQTTAIAPTGTCQPSTTNTPFRVSGSVLYICSPATSNWVAIVGGTGLTDPGSNGMLARTGPGTLTPRTLTGTAGRITITNGDGVAGAPTLDLATSGVTAGSCTSCNLTVDAYGRVTVQGNGSGGASITAGHIAYGNGTGITSDAKYYIDTTASRLRFGASSNTVLSMTFTTEPGAVFGASTSALPYYVFRAESDPLLLLTEEGAGSTANQRVFGLRNNGAVGSIVKVADNFSGITPLLSFSMSSSAATFAGSVITPAATTSIPSLNIPHGTAPTSPTNGDVWTTTTGQFNRINGVSRQVLYTDGDGSALINLNAGSLATGTVAVGRLPVLSGDAGFGGIAGIAPAPGIGDGVALKMLFADGSYKSINDLTTDASPSSANDYVMTWDASAGTHKKVVLSALAGSGAPGGSSGNLQVNNSGAFGGLSGSSFSGANLTLGGTFKVAGGGGGSTFLDAGIKLYANTTQGVYVGYNTTSTYGYIGAVSEGVTHDLLVLQPTSNGVAIRRTSLRDGAILDVGGKLKADSVSFGNSAETPTVINQFAIVHDGTTASVLRNATDDVEYFTQATSSQIIMGTVTAHPISIRVGNADALSIDTSLRARFHLSTTGSGSAALGSNSPAATNSAPYAWIRLRCPDDSGDCYMPVWK